MTLPPPVVLCATAYHAWDTAIPFVRDLLDGSPFPIVLVVADVDTWRDLFSTVDRFYPRLDTPLHPGVSRGAGRQEAIEYIREYMATGSGEDPVIVQLDADTAYGHLPRYVDLYLREHDGTLLNAGANSRPDLANRMGHAVIARLSVFDRLGGYRDLFAREDMDLERRAVRAGLQRDVSGDPSDFARFPADRRGSDARRYERTFARRAGREARTILASVAVLGPWRGALRPLLDGARGRVEG